MFSGCPLRVQSIPLNCPRTFFSMQYGYPLKALDIGVFWFVNFEKRFTGSLIMTISPKKCDNFLENPMFWQKS